MAEDKTIYWMKKKKDFYKRHDIRILLAYPEGYAYYVFLDMIMSESIDHGGELRFSETKPFDAPKLSLMCGMPEKIVRGALNVLCALEIIEIYEDGTIYIPYVAENAGSESESAERVRRHRERKKAQGNDDVTKCNDDVTQGNDDVTKCNAEIELEIEKELDIDDLTIIDKLTPREQKDLRNRCHSKAEFDQYMRFADHQVKHRNEPSPISDWFQYVKQIGVYGGFIADG